MKALRQKITIGITGSPSAGKSRFAKIASKKLRISRVIEIGEIVREKGMYTNYDRKDRSYVADMGKLNGYLSAEIKKDGSLILVGHLLPDLDIMPDAMVVVRAGLEEMLSRMRARGYNKQKIRENIIAEITDYCGETSRAAGIPTIEVFSASDELRAIRTLRSMIGGKIEGIDAGISTLGSRSAEFEGFVKRHSSLGL